MTEKKRLITPVKLEFNLEADNKEFDIGGNTNTILHLLTQNDRSIKITNTEQDLVTQKILLYFMIESTETINRLKFTSPIKQYLLENNIWLKPDLFLIKVESSPGFFTLVHPQMTNKEDFKKEIETALSATRIDTTDKTVKRWMQNNKIEELKNEKGIPLFHIENSLRKWGKIQVEVIKLICMEEDTEYMKYLLSMASSPKKYQEDFLFQQVYN